MNLLGIRFGLLAVATAVLALPAAAAAENLVPPDNGAVNQYTESFPTAGGDKNSEKAKDDGATPAQALGAKNANKLEAQGEDGRVVAEVAAETAPVPSVSVAPAPGQSAEVDGGDRDVQDDSTDDRRQAESEAASGSGGGGGTPSGSGGATPGGGGEAAASGSSGVGEVLRQVTGLSGGQMGLLFPLMVLAGLGWALASLWRRRTQPTV